MIKCLEKERRKTANKVMRWEKSGEMLEFVVEGWILGNDVIFVIPLKGGLQCQNTLLALSHEKFMHSMESHFGLRFVGFLSDKQIIAVLHCLKMQLNKADGLDFPENLLESVVDFRQP
jgi:hypothetical protein